MSKAFLDANIFFAAAKSHFGGSYFILELAKKRRITVVTSAHALAEVERNIEKKLGGEALNEHYENLLEIRPKIQSLEMLPLGLEEKLKAYIPEKDIPILAGAILSEVDCFITLDKKHFLGNKNLSKLNLPFAILTPGSFIQRYF